MSPKNNKGLTPARSARKARIHPATSAVTGRAPAVATPASADMRSGRPAPHVSLRAGKAHVRGTGITVLQVIESLLRHRSGERLLVEYPELDPDDVRAAVDHAALYPDDTLAEPNA
jgi:uncharacterized protein (DUF433 family)